MLPGLGHFRWRRAQPEEGRRERGCTRWRLPGLACEAELPAGPLGPRSRGERAFWEPRLLLQLSLLPLLPPLLLRASQLLRERGVRLE